MTSNIDSAIIEAYLKDTYEKLQKADTAFLFDRLRDIKKQYQIIFPTLIKSKVSMAEWEKTQHDRTEGERKILFQAYEIIQLIRERFTGQVLSYFLYVTDTENNARGISVGAGDIEEFLNFNAKEIDIAVNAVKDRAEELSGNLFSDLMDLETGYFKKPARGNQSVFIQRRERIHEYTRGIIRQKSSRKWATFNRGNILEAIYKVDTDGTTKQEQINSFFNNLRHDNVSGFKGGDSGMVQIKANAARLMRYTSILNAINKVLAIEDAIKTTNVDQNTIQEKVRDMYFDSSASEAIDQTKEKEIQKQVKDFAESLKNALTK